MRAFYRPYPLVKKGNPTSDPFQVPQLSGVPGWIYLTHDKEGNAHAYFTDAKGERTDELALVMDERVCCDTIFRVVRLAPKIYVVYDLFVLNGVKVHETLSFQQRQERIETILELFHQPDLVALTTIADAPVGSHIRGYEQYDNIPGSIGVFSNNCLSDVIKDNQ
jgi:hypothetical protein